MVHVLATGAVALVFWALVQKTYYQYLNYTFVVATAILHGHLGLSYSEPWLNELIPAAHGMYYSVFPLGAVLAVLPFSLLKDWGIVRTYPVDAAVVLAAAGGFWFAYGLTALRRDFSTPKRLMLALWLVLGTWYFTNLLFAGAWQVALGLAVMGELGALYFSLVDRRPFWAGVFFALAYGNRTEILLTAPLFLAFLVQPEWTRLPDFRQLAKRWWPAIWRFAVIPVILGILTLAYNWLRFHSAADFGYARIPGILKEPWYRHGIFSIYAIPGNFQGMILQGWWLRRSWPYLIPDGFGGSIFLASPFLFLLFRRPRGRRGYYLSAWIAIVLLTVALWLHGDTGGWQFSYRYAMELLPWLLLVFIEWLPAKVRPLEAVLWVLSVGISLYATYLFMWTTLVR